MKKLVTSDMSLATSWRSGRDSNPRGIAPKLISSLPGCAHFDNCVEKADIVLPTVGGKTFQNKAGRYKDDLGKFDEKEWILVYDPSSTG